MSFPQNPLYSKVEELLRLALSKTQEKKLKWRRHSQSDRYYAPLRQMRIVATPDYITLETADEVWYRYQDDGKLAKDIFEAARGSALKADEKIDSALEWLSNLG